MRAKEVDDIGQYGRVVAERLRDRQQNADMRNSRIGGLLDPRSGLPQFGCQRMRIFWINGRIVRPSGQKDRRRRGPRIMDRLRRGRVWRVAESSNRGLDVEWQEIVRAGERRRGLDGVWRKSDLGEIGAVKRDH